MHLRYQVSSFDDDHSHTYIVEAPPVEKQPSTFVLALNFRSVSQSLT